MSLSVSSTVGSGVLFPDERDISDYSRLLLTNQIGPGGQRELFRFVIKYGWEIWFGIPLSFPIWLLQKYLRSRTYTLHKFTSLFTTSISKRFQIKFKKLRLFVPLGARTLILSLCPRVFSLVVRQRIIGRISETNYFTLFNGYTPLRVRTELAMFFAISLWPHCIRTYVYTRS